MVQEKMKVGLLGVGLDTYWGQFEGLLPRLLAYQQEICEGIERMDVEVVNAGMVDSTSKAMESALLLRQANVVLIFLFISTYALSSTVLPVAREVGKPVIMLNVQPTPSIDYRKVNSMGDRGKMTGEWLAHCQACSVPEFKQGIYDIAGNVSEWTLEYTSNSYYPCANRGGVYSNNGDVYPAADRDNGTTTFYGTIIGFRVSLF